MVMAILFLSAGFTLGRPPLFLNSLFMIDLFFATDGSAALDRVLRCAKHNLALPHFAHFFSSTP